MTIKNIIKYSNPKMFFPEENETYMGGSGILVIEYVDKTRRILDIKSGIDITEFPDVAIPIVDATQMEYIFKGNKEYYNEFYS